MKADPGTYYGPVAEAQAYWLAGALPALSLAYVSAEESSRDSIVVAGLAALLYREFYQLDWPEVDRPASLDAVRSAASRTWLLCTLPIHFRANHLALAATIDREFRVVQQFPGMLNDGEVVVCLSDSAAIAPGMGLLGTVETEQHAHAAEGSGR